MRPLPFCLQGINPQGRIGRQAGFTLVEVIVAMVIIGILSALMSAGIANIIKGYIFTRGNADTALKGQIALTRISKELRTLDGVTSGSRTSITYSYYLRKTRVRSRTLSWDGISGSPLLLGDNIFGSKEHNILVDKVQEFILTYHTDFKDPGDTTWNSGDTLISATIRIQGPSGVNTDLSIRIAPRNL